MRVSILVVLLGAGLFTGCASTMGGYPLPSPRGPSGDVIVVDDEREERGGVYGARTLGVPKGHYPPPGECRVWYPGREAGQQPPPARCDRLIGREPLGAFILYNDKEWDTRYDWPEHERRNRGSVPGVVLDVMRSLTR